MKDKLTDYLALEEKIATYRLALQTMMYDSSTIAPKNGDDYRNTKMADLAGEIFSLTTSETRYRFLQKLNEQELPLVYRRQIEYQLEDLDKLRVIPKDRYVAFNLLKNQGEKTWENAKEKNDYALFEPTLAQLIEFNKEIYAYRNSDLGLYDQMLDDYEPGTDEKFYDDFFKRVKEAIIPIVAKLPIRDFPFAHLKYPVNKQQEVCKELIKYLDFDSDTLYMGISSHPFSSTFSLGDTRITNRFDPNDFCSSIFSLIHELGHATYNIQVDSQYEGMYIADNMSSGMHESQSRFFENYLARHEAFWFNNFEILQKKFPSQLKEVELADFIALINYAHPSFIRVEADELTYCLHIIIRYEIEKGLFDGSYSTKDLDQVWNQKYYDYLGVKVTDDRTGILQDIHWSSADFGYFPTYALGSAYGAQFYHQLNKELPVGELLKNNEFRKINEWLKEKIHHDGGIYRASEILQRVTGETFDQQYYIEYLTAKFGK